MRALRNERCKEFLIILTGQNDNNDIAVSTIDPSRIPCGFPDTIIAIDNPHEAAISQVTRKQRITMRKQLCGHWRISSLIPSTDLALELSRPIPGRYADFPWDEVRDYYKKWLANMGLDYDEMAKMGDQIRQTRLKTERQLFRSEPGLAL